MRCPFCGNEDTQVKDSRPTDDNAAIRRRRQCPNCGARFTTFERVQLRELVVQYTKQETIDPLKSMGKYIGFGVGGAVLLGLGFTFLAMSLLRVLQTETTAFGGNWSWVPYAIVLVSSAAVAVLLWTVGTRKKTSATTVATTGTTTS